MKKLLLLFFLFPVLVLGQGVKIQFGTTNTPQNLTNIIKSLATNAVVESGLSGGSGTAVTASGVNVAVTNAGVVSVIGTNASGLTGGTLDDARLSSNVVYTGGGMAMSTNRGVFYVLDHGVWPQNSAASNSTAFAVLLTNVYNAGGGTIQFPAGTFSFSDQIYIPNDGASPPHQPPVHIVGAGNYQGGIGNPAPNGSTFLSLLWSNPPTSAKILTVGSGVLGLNNLSIGGGQSSNQTILKTTFTVLKVENVTFYGNVSKTVDAIVLGGDTANEFTGGTKDSSFQGYSTVIEKNFFNYIRTGLRLRAHVNDINFNFNTFWQGCGGDAAAIELNPVQVPSGENTGNVFMGNLIEMGAYAMGVRIDGTNAIGNTFVANNFHDPAPVGAWCYWLTNACSGNNIINGMIANETQDIMYGPGTANNNYWTAQQDGTNRVQNVLRFDETAEFRDTSTPMRIYGGSGTFLHNGSITDGGYFQYLTPATNGALNEIIYRVLRTGEGTATLQLALGGTNTTILNTAGSMKIYGGGVNNIVEMGGHSSQLYHRFNQGRLMTTTQTDTYKNPAGSAHAWSDTSSQNGSTTARFTATNGAFRFYGVDNSTNKPVVAYSFEAQGGQFIGNGAGLSNTVWLLSTPTISVTTNIGPPISFSLAVVNTNGVGVTNLFIYQSGPAFFNVTSNGFGDYTLSVDFDPQPASASLTNWSAANISDYPTLSGNNAFSGANVLSGSNTFTANNYFSGSNVFSGSNYFSGPLVGSLTGNAATATTATNLAPGGAITNIDLYNANGGRTLTHDDAITVMFAGNEEVVRADEEYTDLKSRGSTNRVRVEAAGVSVVGAISGNGSGLTNLNSGGGTGLIGSDASGVTVDVDTMSELETAVGGANVITATEIDSSAELFSILTDEQGSAGVVPRFNTAGVTAGQIPAWNGTDWVPASSTVFNYGAGTNGIVFWTNGFNITVSDSGEKDYLNIAQLDVENLWATKLYTGLASAASLATDGDGKLIVGSGAGGTNFDSIILTNTIYAPGGDARLQITDQATILAIGNWNAVQANTNTGTLSMLTADSYGFEIVNSSGAITVTGDITLPATAVGTTQSAGDNDTSVATTAFVTRAITNLPYATITNSLLATNVQTAGFTNNGTGRNVGNWTVQGDLAVTGTHSIGTLTATQANFTEVNATNLVVSGTTVASLGTATAGKVAYATDVLTPRGSGGFVYADGTDWRTWQNHIIATADLTNYMLNVSKVGLDINTPYTKATWTGVGGSATYGLLRDFVSAASGTGASVSMDYNPNGQTGWFLVLNLGSTTNAYSTVYNSRSSLVTGNRRAFTLNFTSGICDSTNGFFSIKGFTFSTTAYPANGAYFLYDPFNLTGDNAGGSTNWLCVTRASSTSTVTDSGLPATSSGFKTFTTVQHSTSSCQFYTNGALATTHTANIYTGPLYSGSIIVRGFGSTAIQEGISYAGVHTRFASAAY